MDSLSKILKDIDLTGFVLSGNLREDLGRYCDETGISIHEFGNIIAYRLSFGPTLTVHALTNAVIKKILNTRMETMPTEMPRALQNSFLFEAKDGELFDGITAIGGMLLDNDLVLISAYADGNTYWQHEQASFDGRSLADIQFDRDITSIDGYTHETIDRATRKDTFAFAIVLALMLEAERTPITVGDKGKRQQQSNKTTIIGKKRYPLWIEKRIYIDTKYANTSEHEHIHPMDKDGKIRKGVQIEGFLRHQAYGPGFKLRKWIYVEGFESSRWISQGDKLITIDLHPNKNAGAGEDHNGK
jgi:hypothetical protein